MRISRKLLENVDWLLIGITLALSLLGVMTIYSATRPLPGGVHQDFYLKQIYWLLISFVAMGAVVSMDYRWLERSARWLFGISMVLLLAVLVMGRVGMGAKRWLSLGFMNFQPSEFYKLVLMVMLARYFTQFQRDLNHRDIFGAFFMYTLLPVLMIIKQPDLGTSLVILALFAGMVIAKGVGKRLVTITVIIALVSVPFIGSIAWDELKPYQKKRIIAFINPDSDAQGISYHVQQSKVAVGSGGLVGKGYLKGTQGPFRFLPEKHTDFIFAIFAEEWGFIGGLTILLLYIGLIFRGIHIAIKAKDEFGRFLAFGITYMFVIYCFINIGMTVGLVPVVGIPLPFMSYGGTALLSNYIGIGLLLSIHTRRFELFY